MCMCVVSLFTDYNFDLIDRGGLELLCDSEKIHKVNVDLPHGADEAKLQSFMCFFFKSFYYYDLSKDLLCSSYKLVNNEAFAFVGSHKCDQREA